MTGTHPLPLDHPWLRRPPVKPAAGGDPSPLLRAARAVMAVWAALKAALSPADPDDLPCGICALGFVEGDPCHNDVDLGPVHAACCGPERESYVGAGGEPLREGEPLPTPWIWTAEPRAAAAHGEQEPRR